MKNTKNILVATCLGLSFTSFASDNKKYSHFPAKKSPDAETALCNIVNYNKVLTQLTQKEELSVEDMVKIHELTYTLENALGKLSEDLAKAAVDLEEVHLASEKLDTDTIKKHANIYANITTAFSAKQTCGEQKSKVKSQKSKV
jgi:hypothetical protein